MGYIGNNRLTQLLTLIKNKFAFKSDIPTNVSDLNNDANYVADANYTHITVDDTLSSTSTNPIQNKAVKDAIDNIKAVSDWSDVENKPFNSVDTDTLSTDGGVLSVIGGGSGGASTWDELSEKPFETLDEDTLEVNDGVLKVIGGGGSTTNVYYSYDDYAEEERVIGRYKDGKPLYRKIVYSTMPTVETAGVAVSKEFSVGDIDTITRLEATCINNDEQISINPAFLNAGHNVAKVLYYDVNKAIRITSEIQGFNGRDVRIIMEYTKDADAPNSFDPSMIMKNQIELAGGYYENYSEDEIVVGKWINGKPIYKCINIVNGMTWIANSWSDIFNAPLNIEKIINIYLLRTTNGGYQSLIKARINDGKIQCYDYLAFDTTETMFAIIEYTKTTDAPNSFNPTMIKSNVVGLDIATDEEVEEVFA